MMTYSDQDAETMVTLAFRVDEMEPGDRLDLDPLPGRNLQIQVQCHPGGEETELAKRWTIWNIGRQYSGLFHDCPLSVAETVTDAQIEGGEPR